MKFTVFQSLIKKLTQFLKLIPHGLDRDELPNDQNRTEHRIVMD